MQPPTARIFAASRRQAMDWSLVLASQGMEPTIEANPEGKGFVLLVPEDGYETAMQSIRQFRAENRGWPWQQPVFNQSYLFDWACLGWVVLIGAFFWLSTIRDLHTGGVMDSSAVARGEWWRLFTAVWLHADIAHFASNAAVGVVLLGLAMGQYGSGNGILAAYLAGAGGNLLAFATRHSHLSLGASGMVMGSLGLLAVSTFSGGRATPRWRYALGGIIGGAMLFLLLGVAPGSDVLAHAGGFISGILLGLLLRQFRRFLDQPAPNFASAFLFALLVVVPWLFASSRATG